MTIHRSLGNVDLKVVSGLLINTNQVLLCLRKNTRYFSGYWSLPIGHLENNETYPKALARELAEELDIQVLNSELLTILSDTENNIEHQCFTVKKWSGEIKNIEPYLCSQIEWFSFDLLPQPITPATQTILSYFRSLNGLNV